MSAALGVSDTPPSSSAEPVLRLRAVSKSFGAVAALTDVDLDVVAGEVLAIVGDNGAGKSTLVKVLSGVHPPDAGTVERNGRQIALDSPAAARDLGIATVFQDLALCENLDVTANLFLGQEIRRHALDDVAMEVRAWELLRELSAKLPTLGVPVSSLSGGQRQTVAIARTLLGEPEVIILDEPTAALGVEQTAEVLDLVERLRDKGLAVILISHNMEDVRAVADKITVLRLGRNNGSFDVVGVTNEDLIAAITGATDNAVTRRGRRRAGAVRDDRGERQPDHHEAGERS